MARINPYANSIAISYGNGEYSIERKSNTPNLNGSSKIHTVLEGETLQSIANKYYGDSGYWFDIAEYNNIIHPFEDLKENMEILIP